MARSDAFGETWELIRLPASLGLAAIVATWIVWYFTTVPCTDELAERGVCVSSWWAAFISLDVLTGMLSNGAIVAGAGGLYQYVMGIRERQRIEDVERRIREIEEERKEERRLFIDGQRQLLEDHHRLTDRVLELTDPRTVNQSASEPQEHEDKSGDAGQG